MRNAIRVYHVVFNFMFAMYILSAAMYAVSNPELTQTQLAISLWPYTTMLIAGGGLKIYFETKK